MFKELPLLIRRDVPRNIVSGKSIEGYAADAYFIIDDNLLGKVAIVKKWTRYVNNPADAMVIPLESNISQLTDLDYESGIRFMELCSFLATTMHDKLGAGFPVIAINQQTDCQKLPYKYSDDGTEVKVQTIDQLHAHVFVEDGLGVPFMAVGDLPKEDRYCFYDPLAEVASEIVCSPSFFDKELYGIEKTLSNNGFPMGVKFAVEGNSSEMGTLFAVMKTIQTRYVNLYREIERELLENGQVVGIQARRSLLNRLNSEFDLSRKSRAILYYVLNNLRDYSNEERKFMRFVQGPALTWIIYEDKNHLLVNLSPRILSRGNASESLGIWVEPIDSDNVALADEQSNFFRSLINSLQGRLNIYSGPQLLQR